MIIEKRKKIWWYLLQLQGESLRRAKLLQLQSQKEIIVGTTKENSWTKIFFLSPFYKKNEIRDYFYVIGWKS